MDVFNHTKTKDNKMALNQSYDNELELDDEELANDRECERRLRVIRESATFLGRSRAFLKKYAVNLIAVSCCSIFVVSGFYMVVVYSRGPTTSQISEAAADAVEEMINTVVVPIFQSDSIQAATPLPPSSEIGRPPRRRRY